MTSNTTDIATTTDRSVKGADAPFTPRVGAGLGHDVEPTLHRWAMAPFDVASAWTSAWRSYASNAIERRATPLDMARDPFRFWRAALERSEPTWSTPFEVAQEWPVARLLDFSTEPDECVLPVVILPPQAGHASTVVDHTPQQSQVRTALDKGLPVYVLEWVQATRAVKDTTVEDYIAILDETVEHLGGRVTLVGDCQGGWLATIYAALRPEAVAGLAIGGAPIDCHAGQGALTGALKSQTRRRNPMWGYRALVAGGFGVHRGRSQIMAFKMMEPAGELSRLADLWAHIDDPDHVQRYREFNTWFEHPQDMAGAFYLWVVEHIFVRNELAAGTLEVGGQTVDLSRIEVPVHLLAGSKDHITPPEQVWALAGLVSTPEDQVHGRLVDAGHLGLFMGHRSLREHWSEIFGALTEVR